MTAIDAGSACRTASPALAAPASTGVTGRQTGMLGEQTALHRSTPPGARTGSTLPLHCRLPGRNQMLLAVADQIGTPHLGQSLAQQRPVLRVMVAQEGLVQPALALALDRAHSLALVIHPAQRVLARMVHGRGRGHRRGIEG